jgi:hypothetical protein
VTGEILCWVRERVTIWLDERPVRLAVIFAVLAVLMVVASVDAWLNPGYAGGREDRRAVAMYLGPILGVLCAWAAWKMWRLDRSERDRR